MRALLLALVFAAGCAHAPPAPAPAASEADQARQALAAFVQAVQEEHFDAAWGLLSARWRARLTPERLAQDLREGEGLARDRLERARLAAARPPDLDDGRASFEIGDAQEVRMVHEADGWKVDSLY